MSNFDPTDTVQTILSAVRDQYGIAFTETMTGGGCMALEARLESGHWIVATDEGLCGFRERVTFESVPDNYNSHASDDHRAMGWSVGIYPNEREYASDGTYVDGWFGVDSICDVIDYDAYADALPVMVGRALAALADSVRRH